MPCAWTDNAQCLGCGYSLRGLDQHRCPECGRGFDPGNPKTFFTARVPGSIGRFLLKPPGYPLALLTLAAAVVMLVAAVPPGGHFDLLLIGVLCWIPVGIIAWPRGSRDGRCAVLPHRPVLQPPGVAVLASSRGLRLPAADGEPAISCRVLDQPRCPEPVRSPGGFIIRQDLPDQPIGIYSAECIQRTDHGVCFLIRGTGFIDPYGLEHAPAGIPNDRSSRDYRPVGGGWYVWRYDF